MQDIGLYRTTVDLQLKMMARREGKRESIEEVSIEKEAVLRKRRKKWWWAEIKAKRSNGKGDHMVLVLATPILEAAWERKTCRPSRNYIMI